VKLVGSLFVIVAALLPAPQQRFTSATTLLTVDATVTDADGKPVPGLTAADFEVKLNGKVQPVRAVAFLEAATSSSTMVVPAAASAVAAPAPAPAETKSPAEARVFVILLDDLSIRAGNSKGLLVSAERFVSRLSPHDIVGFTTTSGLVTVNPTRDRDELLKRLRRAQGQMFDTREVTRSGTGVFVGTFEALQYDDGFKGVLLNVIQRECTALPPNVIAKRLEQLIVDDPCAGDVERSARLIAKIARRNAQDQLNVMENVIRAMGTADGIKHLVIVSGGIGVTTNTVDFIPVAKAAAVAGVQLTVLAEEPDDVDVSSWGSTRAKVQDDRSLLGAEEMLTDMSGGQFYRVIGQAERFYDRVLMSASAVYRLGVELPPDVAAGADVAVQVHLIRRGLTVLASHHSVAPAPPPPPLPVGQQLKNAITSGKPSYGVPLTLDPEVVHSTGPNPLAIRVVVTVPSTVAGPLTGVFGFVDDSGSLLSGKRALDRTADGRSYRAEFLVPVNEGMYRLRFAVADAKGAVGAVEVKVTAK
jgi:VWFA-related protein